MIRPLSTSKPFHKAQVRPDGFPILSYGGLVAAVASILIWLASVPLLQVAGFLASLLATSLVRSPYVKAILYGWTCWYVLGLVTYAASVATRVSYLVYFSPDPNVYGDVYISFLLTSSVSSLLTDRLFFGASPTSENTLRLERPDFYVLLSLVLFSIVYSVSIYIAAGGAPILSGDNISASMYETSYSHLQGYTFFCVLAVTATFLYRSQLKRPSFTYALLGFLIVLSAVDGRRVFALLGVASIILSVYAGSHSSKKVVTILGLALLAIGFMLFAHSLRTGGAFELNSALDLLSSLAGEYRDSIYMVARYTQGDVLSTGYDWLGSTASSMVNSQVMSAFGLDKSDLATRDSARTFRIFFNTPQGIRTGIFTELWFAYGWLGTIPVAMLFSFITVLSVIASRATSYTQKIVLVSLLANFALAIMGQSSFVFGLFATALYGFLALEAVKIGYTVVKR